MLDMTIAVAIRSVLTIVSLVLVSQNSNAYCHASAGLMRSEDFQVRALEDLD